MTHNEPYLGEVGRLIYDLAAERKRPLSFPNRGVMSVARWRRKARGAFLEGLGCPFEKVDLDVRVTGSVERDGYTEKRITFASTRLHRVPACVLIPHRGKPPFPAVVPCTIMAGSICSGRKRSLNAPANASSCGRSQKGAMKDGRGRAALPAVYAAWGKPKQFRRRFYDLPHCFNTQMQEEMFDWLDNVFSRS